MSSLRSKELEIPGLKPFENCKLDREKYAEILTQIIESYSDGFVLSVNNKWGEGKTTFIKMWKVYLGNKGFKSVYFNAWEHDFGQDPMAAILSEIKSLELGDKAKLEGIIKKAANFSIHAIPILLKAVADKYVDTDTFSDGIKGLSEKAIDAFQNEVDEYAKKKDSLVKFKEALGEYVAKLEKPLVFIIDELDRCNPKYAVEVLEIIKHFFSVPGIVFVLSIDKEQLGNAIRGYFGSDRIDADEYLRRFIDLEYSIPKPNIDSFTNYMFEHYSFKDFFFSQERMKYTELGNDAEKFLSMAEYLLTKSQATLRQQQRIFVMTRLVLRSFQINHYTFPNLLFLLIYLKQMDPDIYKKIEDRSYSLQELSDAFGDLFLDKDKDEDTDDFGYLEALLLWFYNNNNQYKGRSGLLKMGENGKYQALITSKLTKSDERLASFFADISRRGTERIKLNYLLDKVKLCDPIVL